MKTCPVTGLCCLKPCVFHITDVKDGKAQKQADLCHDCVKEYLRKDTLLDVNPLQDINPFKFIEEIFGVINSIIHTAKEEDGKQCPGCGSTLQQIFRIGRLGCSTCYDYFKDELSETIKRSQGGKLVHTGKRPKQYLSSDKLGLLEKIKECRVNMQEAIQQEKYEEAAQFRDRIKKLEYQESQKNILIVELKKAIEEQNNEKIQEIQQQISGLVQDN